MKQDEIEWKLDHKTGLSHRYKSVLRVVIHHVYKI